MLWKILKKKKTGRLNVYVKARDIYCGIIVHNKTNNLRIRSTTEFGC